MPNKATYNWATINLSGDKGARISLVVQGAEIPISQFSMSYAVNDIPTATVLVALGRNAHDGNKSSVYDIVKNVSAMTTAYIQISGKLGDWSTAGSQGSRLQFPEANKVILFTGYLVGTSYVRSGGKVSLALHLINQLTLLTMTVGGTSHILPGTPYELTKSVLYDGTGGKVSSEFSTKYAKELATTIITDFSKAVLDVMYSIAEDSTFIQSYDPSVLNTFGRSNKAALYALSAAGDGRWLGMFNRTQGGYLDGYVGEYPLNTNGVTIADSIAQSISRNLNSSGYSNDMWTTLVYTLLADYGCAVIPFPRAALVAPVLPMSQSASSIIKVSDIVDFSMNASIKQPVRAVGVFSTTSLRTINAEGLPVDNPSAMIGGKYIASDKESDGGWYYKKAPDWLDNTASMDPNEENPDVNKLMNKVGNNANGGELGVARQLGQQVTDVNQYLNKYAQLVYLGIALKNRQATLVTKLRFDISPGSTVRLELQPEAVSGAVDLLSSGDAQAFYYGFVNQVTVSIDAEQGFASTNYVLTNLRSKSENETAGGRFSMATHPFFDARFFRGGPLVPELVVKGG